MKVLANDGISQSGISMLEAAGHEVITENVPQNQLIEAINKEGYEVVIVRSATTIRKEVIDACPNLKMIGRGGVGMDNIDVEYARSIGRLVFNTPGASSQSVAELVMTQMFSLARTTYDANRQMPEHGSADFKGLKKKYGKGIELRGKTLGIIGIGRIGQSLASYALGCGMNVIAYDPFVEKVQVSVFVAGEEVKVNLNMVDMDTLLSSSDFISLHVPKQANGSAVIGTSEIAKMKDGVRLANAARGGVVDEDALIEALNSGKVAAAALDVFENEPAPRTDLLNHSHIATTPHVGAATQEAQDRIGEELATFIIDNA
ncbi:MAG: 3-phosphoglycerate dehydrogenase [Crocinitomicaceae bacterium]|nr:3-phosphoglycerate dehydrogenase [Crocinitomicaceae bacterium]|tara:strand:- start:13940 stop:14890 length:951 start_codon:yes stop_codon:yes gene_type:complete